MLGEEHGKPISCVGRGYSAAAGNTSEPAMSIDRTSNSAGCRRPFRLVKAFLKQFLKNMLLFLLIPS